MVALQPDANQMNDDLSIAILSSSTEISFERVDGVSLFEMLAE